MIQDDLHTSKQITSGKYQRLMALSDERGVIAALASSHPDENSQGDQQV